MSYPETRKTGTRKRIYSYLESVEDFLSKRWVMASLTVIPAATLFLLIVALPILWAIIASFYEIPSFSPVWQWTGIDNYQFIFQDSLFFESLGRNLVWAGGTAFLNTTLGISVALLLNRKFKFKQIAVTIAFLPYLIPTAFLAYFALWMTNQQWGVINQILLMLGIVSSDGMIAFFSGNQTLAMLSMIVTHSWRYSIFVAILVLARLQSIPDDLYESAQMSGATMYQQFRDITLPNIKNVLFIVLLLRSVWNFNQFDIIWVLTKGGPGKATTTLPVYAYEQAFLYNSLGLASAVSVVLFVFLSVVAIIYFKVAEPSKEIRVE